VFCFPQKDVLRTIASVHSILSGHQAPRFVYDVFINNVWTIVLVIGQKNVAFVLAYGQ